MSRQYYSNPRYLETDHYVDHRLIIGMHVGTHIDGPMHLTESQEYVSDINVESFMGEGCLLDVRHLAVIGLKLEYLEWILERSIVLLYTGFDRFYGQPEYYENHPVVNDELCQLLIDKRNQVAGNRCTFTGQSALPNSQATPGFRNLLYRKSDQPGKNTP